MVKRWLPLVLSAGLLLWMGVVAHAGVLTYGMLQDIGGRFVAWPASDRQVSLEMLPQDAGLALIITNHSQGPAAFHLSRVEAKREVPVQAGRLLAGQATRLPVADECDWRQASPYLTLVFQADDQSHVVRTWLNLALTPNCSDPTAPSQPYTRRSSQDTARPSAP